MSVVITPSSRTGTTSKTIYYYGHYFADLVEAARDFEERVARSELRRA
jgi:hypothetical protein